MGIVLVISRIGFFIDFEAPTIPSIAPSSRKRIPPPNVTSLAKYGVVSVMLGAAR